MEDDILFDFQKIDIPTQNASLNRNEMLDELRVKFNIYT